MARKASEVERRRAVSLLDLASPVSERVQITDVHLLETRAKRGPMRPKLPAHLGFSVNVTTQVDEPNSTILVRPFLSVVAKYDETVDGEEPLCIEARFLLTYSVKSLDGLNTANFVAFGETNGLYNAWPFWREYVQATTARLGLPALTIPVLPPALRDSKTDPGAGKASTKTGRGRPSKRLAPT